MTSSGCFQNPFSGHLQDIFKSSYFKYPFKNMCKIFCTWITYRICINLFNIFTRIWPYPHDVQKNVFKTFSYLGTLSKTCGFTLKTSRRSLLNVFLSGDCFQRIWRNPQDVQRKSSKRFYFQGLLPDVLMTRSCAHWAYILDESNMLTFPDANILGVYLYVGME